MSYKSVPNILTGGRIVLSLAVFVALCDAALQGRAQDGGGSVHGPVLFAFVAFVVCALTDFFDGWLARRLDARSTWGAILDPIADKLAVLSAVLGLLLLEPRLGVAAPGFLILFREVFVSGLRESGASLGLSFPVTRLAKWKTTVQLVALSLELLAASWGWHALAIVSDGLLWLAAALTLWTGAQYTLAAVRQL